MAYDKASFLAGLAAGRNMESWPAMEGISVFKFTVYVYPGALEFFTPYMVFRGTIDWGDGSTSDFDNLPDNYYYSEAFRGRASHTYASGGERQIKLIGDLRDWATVANSSSLTTRGELRSVDSPWPSTMAKRTSFALAFYGSTELKSLPTRLFRNIIKVSSISRMCHRCRKLQHLPEKLLEGCENCTSAAQVFMSCDLRELPPDLFAYLPRVTSAAGFFSYNERLTDIPEGIFDPLQALTVPPGLNSLGIHEIPPALFLNCPHITDFSFLFQDSPLRSVQADVFAYCPGAASFEGTFQGTQITELPPDLFAHNPNVKWMRETFRDLPLTSIPLHLFDACTAIENFTYCFKGCSEVTGPLPALWLQFPDAQAYDCFAGCVNASNYADVPGSWGGPS